MENIENTLELGIGIDYKIMLLYEIDQLYFNVRKLLCHHCCKQAISTLSFPYTYIRYYQPRSSSKREAEANSLSAFMVGINHHSNKAVEIILSVAYDLWEVVQINGPRFKL